MKDLRIKYKSVQLEIEKKREEINSLNSVLKEEKKENQSKEEQIKQLNTQIIFIKEEKEKEIEKINKIEEINRIKIEEEKLIDTNRSKD